MNELNVYRDYKDLKSTKNILIKISEILKNHLSFETCKRELLGITPKNWRVLCKIRHFLKKDIKKFKFKTYV